MKAIPWILVGALFALSLFIHFDGCGGHGNPGKVDTVYKKDTLWAHYDTVVKKPTVIKVIIHDSIPVPFDPHPDYDSLKAQYLTLVIKHSAKNVYADSLNLGDYGYLQVQDTVQYNQLGNRSYLVNYKIPTIIDTVTIREQIPEKPALYYGGGVSATGSGVSLMHLGLLYKSKNQHISGVYIGVAPGFKLAYGMHTYWKISRKK